MLCCLVWWIICSVVLVLGGLIGLFLWFMLMWCRFLVID